MHMTADERRSQAEIDTIAMLSVRVHPDLRKRLKRHSVESGSSMAEIVEAAITRYLDEEERA
jgi:predicted DNA-binding protein